MKRTVYRYQFADSVSVREIEETFQLALVAAQSIHGESRVRMDVRFAFDSETGVIAIDAGTLAGSTVNELFTGFVRVEFGERKFKVERIDAVPEAEPVA